MKQYLIYADGSCLGNPGNGGAAIVITTPAGEVIREFARGYPKTTNNRMELHAAIAALKAMPEGDLTIVTDSQYVIRGITEWLAGWKRKGWQTAGKKPVLNQELWRELDALAAAHVGPLQWRWVRGHATSAGNCRADELARAAAERIA
jgi:ribonuclease HI